MKSPTLLPLLLVSIALVGCGGAEPDATTTGAQSMRTASTPRPAPSARATDRVIARAALLQLSDFPPGWTLEPSDDRDDFHCPAIDRVERNPNAESGRFELGRVHALSQEVVVFRSAAAAESAIDALIARTTLACIARKIGTATRRSAYPGNRIGRLTIARLPIAAAGHRTEGARLAIPVSGGGVSTHVYGDFAFTRVGRSVSLIALLSQRLPADELRTQLVARAAERLAEALAGGKT